MRRQTDIAALLPKGTIQRQAPGLTIRLNAPRPIVLAYNESPPVRIAISATGIRGMPSSSERQRSQG